MDVTTCECCKGLISPKAKACPHCGHPVGKKASETAHGRFAWGVVFLLSVLSIIGVFVATFMESDISAPQQCAVIAACIGFTVIPYCYARAVEKF
jgi:hypothetical protein